MIAGPRDGVAAGPQLAKIRIPKLSGYSQAVSDILRTNTSLKKYQFEIITLIVARQYNSDYMWGAHVRDGKKVGLSETIIDDINYRRRPVFDNEEDG